jgi:hypothetical protein
MLASIDSSAANLATIPRDSSEWQRSELPFRQD